jgi:hypothetical protein
MIMKATCYVPILFSLSAAFYCVAQESAFTHEAQAKLGVLNNSTLVVAELDQVSNQQDVALTMNAKLAGQWRATSALTLQGGYSFARKDFQAFDSYDLDLHQLYVDAQYDFAWLSVGVRHDLAKAILQDEAFLSLNQTSIYTAKYLTTTTYLRSALIYKDKKFDSMASRDATNRGVDLNLFQFFAGGNTMLAFGLSGEQEEALDQQFNYSSNSLNSSVLHKFELFGQASQVQLDWRYRHSTYTDSASNTAPQRKDIQQSIQLQWQQAIWRKMSVVAKVEYSDNQSSLPQLNYAQTISLIELQMTF